jgi:cyclopropane fatty-acyl-phospholipid synthase-like methyltransferase
MLRYAHTRAEALGVPVHFHLRSADDTNFPNDYFDLVVSHNMMHEISDRVRRRMMKETFRILRPGGIAIHQDVMVRYKDWSLFEQAERSWDQSFNNEPFWDTYGEADVPADMAAAGFGATNVKELNLVKIDGPGSWYAVVAVKPKT